MIRGVLIAGPPSAFHVRFSEHMMRQRYGRIVCMSSGAREGTPWTAYDQGGSAYSAAKAGVHGFVRDVALELAEHGINVNAVAPARSTPSAPAPACGS